MHRIRVIAVLVPALALTLALSAAPLAQNQSGPSSPSGRTRVGAERQG